MAGRASWAVVPAVIAVALSAAGSAHAASSPQVVGQKYSDAESALKGAGSSVVVSTTVGDETDRSNCIVTHQQDRSVPPPENTSAAATREALLTLNCDAMLATATKPGNSLASPAGAAEAKAEKAEKAKQASQGAAHH